MSTELSSYSSMPMLEGLFPGNSRFLRRVSLQGRNITEISKDSEYCSYLRESSHLAISSIKVAELDALQAGVHPVQSTQREVNGKAVRPRDVSVNEYGSCTAVHSCALDLCIFTPVGPEHVAG